MSKSKCDNIRQHILYPQNTDNEFGCLYNEDNYFGYLAPEEAQQLLNAQEQQSTIEVGLRRVPILKGCFQSILQGNMTEEHLQCYSFLISYGDFWDLSCSCQHLSDAEFLKEIRELGGDILSHIDIQRRIDAAQPSSIYENPFLGFDNPDKQYAPQEWLVEDMFPARSLNALVGVSDSFKSFLAIHLACCIATGTPFFGKDVQQGPVLFLAPEGGEGVPKRREAWKTEHGWQDCYVPFFTRSASFSFSNEDDLHFLRNKLNVASEFAPKAVFFDTLGQSLGNYDENSAKDINRVARYLNDLKFEFNCSFFWVDHAGYEAKRSRGSSAKFGALDTEFFVSRTGDELKVQNTKMKDADKCAVLYLQSQKRNGSLILQQIEQPQTHTETLMKIIKEATDLSLKSIRKKFYEVCKAETPQSQQKAFKRAFDALVKAEKILEQQTPDGAKLALTTESGHTHPSL